MSARLKISQSAAAAALALILPLTVGAQAPRELTVAVAANFAGIARQFAADFEAATKTRVVVSVGSTGALYAQIVSGAPYDVLLAADDERPRRLEESGHALPGSRFTYALGVLVVWSASPAFGPDDCRGALLAGGRTRIAIANPRTAPYGRAARQALERLGARDTAGSRIVTANNVMQALTWAATGNADVAIVADALTRNAALPTPTCSWRVPAELYDPIAQQAVLLTRAPDRALARAFLDALRSGSGRRRIADAGYRLAD